jgi:hypothetical protein
MDTYYQRRLEEAKAAGPDALAAFREKINSKRRNQSRSAKTNANHHKYRCRKAHLVREARKRAKKAGIPFSLKQDDVVWNTRCPILGTCLDYSRVGQRMWDFLPENIPSLDRILPKLGYVPGNVAVISLKANTIKNNGTAEIHRKIADWMDAQSVN